LSSKLIHICDVCNKEIDMMTELYETIDQNPFGVEEDWDVCESCMIKIKSSISNIIMVIKSDGI